MSLERYLEKLDPSQKKLYCQVVPEQEHRVKSSGLYYAKKQLGKDSILSTFREGASILGLSTDRFCSHSLRAFFITNLVNDPRVPLRQSMDAARYTSAQAHLVYQTKSKESEANKIRALIDAGN